MSADLLAAATIFAQHGWPVLPCRPGDKRPLTRRGFLDASCDLDWIAACWSRWPAANVGIRTGYPGPDVLDLDRTVDGDGFAALAELQDSGLLPEPLAVVRTRNRGQHPYYPGSKHPCARWTQRHVDLKAAGGYVLAPPSTVPPDDWTPVSSHPAALGRYVTLHSARALATPLGDQPAGGVDQCFPGARFTPVQPSRARPSVPRH